MALAGEFSVPYYRTNLSSELERRCAGNPRYSMRSFARVLGMDPSLLSKVLRGRAPLSPKAAVHAVQVLGLEPDASRMFLDSVGDEGKKVRLGKVLPASFDSAEVREEHEIDSERFRIISDWYHYGILELTFVPEFKSDPIWIGRRLGISATEARLAVERLFKLGLLKEENGRWVKSDGMVTTKNKTVTTPAFRRLQRQVLQMALHSLENDPIEERSHTSMTMAINPEKVELARKLISEFNRYLCLALGSGKKKRVYHLGINLYPVEGRQS